jgi:hypothetical protein
MSPKGYVQNASVLKKSRQYILMNFGIIISESLCIVKQNVNMIANNNKDDTAADT